MATSACNARAFKKRVAIWAERRGSAIERFPRVSTTILPHRAPRSTRIFAFDSRVATTTPVSSPNGSNTYLPHTCDVKFQVSSSCALCSSKQCETDDETAAVVVGVATSVKLLQFEDVGYG